MRRFAKVLLGILVVSFALIAILPVFIQVDDYRPKIVSLANEKINGSLELGKLSLSLWGQIKINVDGVKLSDNQGKVLLSVKDVFVHVPFMSVFSGSPLLAFRMKEPQVSIVKDTSGKLNVMSLMKSEANVVEKSSVESRKAESETHGKAASEKPGNSGSLPGFVTRARLGIEMQKALLTFEDQKADLKSQVKDLDIEIKDLSLNRPMSLKMAAEIATTMGKTVKVRGPISMKATVTPSFKGSDFKTSDLLFETDLSGVEVLVPGVFEKTAKIPAEMRGEITASNDSAEFKSFKIKFHNAEAILLGKVSGFTTQVEPTLDLTLKSNEIELKPWNALVPPLKQYELDGTFYFEANVSGTPSKPRYQASIKGKKMTAKAPQLKSPPLFEAALKIVTDQIESLNLEMKAPGSDLKVQGKVVSFSNPKVEVSVVSNGLDLDQWIDFSAVGANETGSSNSDSGKKPETQDLSKREEAKSEGPGNTKGSDLDALLEPLRENSVIKKTVATLETKVAFLKAKNVKLNNIQCTADFRDLNLKLTGFRLGVFGGTVKQNVFIEMAPKIPKYRFDFSVEKLNLQEAIASQFQLFKNTLLGLATFKIEGNGSSFNPEPAKRNLTAKGGLRIENATFATIDIGKSVAEGVSKTLNQLGEKIPSLKGKGMGTPQNIESKYSLITADFTINGGKFSSSNFLAKAEVNRGLDLKGSTEVSIIDYGLQSSWDVVDTYNLTKAKDLSVEQQGIVVPNILAEQDGFVHFPIKIGGTAFKPEVSYSSAPEALGKVALSNTTRAVSGKAKAELKKKVEEAIQKQAPPQLQDALKSIGGKIFGN